MPIFYLCTAKRTPTGEVGLTNITLKLRAKDKAKAVAKAKRYPLMHFLDDANFVWLADEKSKVVWSVTLDERDC